jgi:hypothetical protein
VLERLLSGVSPTARRGITFALIGVAWAGFLIAVLSGLAAGILYIVFGFALCWFAASMLGAKSGTVHEAPAAAGGSASEDPGDIEARIRKRLESMKSEDAPKDDGAST